MDGKVGWLVGGYIHCRCTDERRVSKNIKYESLADNARAHRRVLIAHRLLRLLLHLLTMMMVMAMMMACCRCCIHSSSCVPFYSFRFQFVFLCSYFENFS